MKRRLNLNFLCISGVVLCGASPTVLGYSNQDVANLLGWIPDPQANLCRGYYTEPPGLAEVPSPGGVTNAPTHLSYSGGGELHAYGESAITQEIVLTQPGRIARADKAIIYRDPQSGRITTIRLEGHVQVREHGRLVTGPYCTLQLDEHSLKAGPMAYHLYEDPKKLKFPTITRAYDAWGTADKTVRDSRGLLSLWNATYTTCAPTDPAWKISAQHIVLDQKEGFGTAYNMMLRFYSIPVMAAPIYSFPIDNRRKTGFLTPDISYESKNGVQFSFPYYWNLAPNYDLLTTPRWIQDRGFQLTSLFRYLMSPGNDGEVYLSLVPNDNAFRSFRDDTLNNPPPAPNGVSLTPYLNDLENDGNPRGFLHFKHAAEYDEHWNAHLQTNYVTDDYYFRDFGYAYNDVIANQLLNQADVEYQDENWNFTGLLQGYQTLHLIEQDGNPSLNQYIRLPELDFNGNYGNFWKGMDFGFSGQSVNFLYQSDFDPTTLQQPIGERLHLQPTLSHPWLGAGWYFTPQIALDSTSYAAQSAVESGVGDRPAFNASRNLPIVDVDSGLYFDRRFQVNEQAYLATLEPRVFYLYVPFLNQNQYPNFDSTLLPFTFSQLFTTNRFTSFDRLENADQFSFGLTSRLLNSETTAQQLKLDLGFGYYLQSPQVCLDAQDCQTSTFQYVSPTTHITPLVGQLTYYPWQDWTTGVSYAYDASLGKTNNATVGVNYNHNQTEVLTATYQFVREQNGDPTDLYGLSNDTHLISAGAAWPLNRQWSGLAYYSYNISKKRADSYYGGLQYDTCCWTLRAIASRSFSGQNTDENGDPINLFKNAYYVQLQLKSLGNIGTGRPDRLLANTLSGYLDPFK